MPVRTDRAGGNRHREMRVPGAYLAVIHQQAFEAAYDPMAWLGESETPERLAAYEADLAARVAALVEERRGRNAVRAGVSVPVATPLRRKRCAGGGVVVGVRLVSAGGREFAVTSDDTVTYVPDEAA